jgi:hypothetical protein
MSKTFDLPPWWGYSSDHGWVVIDRTIPLNSLARGQDFLFFRCRDSALFFDRRSRWVAPRYIYASTYIGSLEQPKAEEMALEYSVLRSRWAEFEAEIRRQYAAIESERQQAESERIRAEQEKKAPKAAKPRARRAAGVAGTDAQVSDV